jgi:alkylation response protein AidB-like acyl-CoA dehydrogenase
MDFEDSLADKAYRAAARDWLAENAAPRRGGWDTGLGADIGPAELAAARDWQRRKADAGYAAITVPQAYGGGGGTAMQQVIYRQEESRFRVPAGVFEISLGNCIPTLLALADEDDKHRFVPPAVRGDQIWCQLFSEPAAGSDLAALRMRARRERNGWLLNGQKVWTSGAHFADYGIVLTRSDPSVPKHAGLTMFWVDMRSSGISCRPIRQMSGSQEFNEVFFADVFVPDAQRLGVVNDGWAAAMLTLGHERGAVGAGIPFLTADDLIDFAREHDPALLEDSAIAEAIADVHVLVEGLRLNHMRSLTRLSRGEVPGPEFGIGKMMSAICGQKASYLAMDMLGERGALTRAELGDAWGMVERSWTWGAAMRIAGGTEEILLNLIAERVLGLPREARTDKTLPFSELPT